MVARHSEFISRLAEEISQAVPIIADAGEPAEAKSAVGRVRRELGKTNLLLHNASSSNRGGLLDTSPEQFAAAWRVASLGAFVCA